MKIDVKPSLLIFAFFAGVSVHIVQSVTKHMKTRKRMKRNEAFLAEVENWKMKYTEEPEDGGKQATAEFIALMEKYGL